MFDYEADLVYVMVLAVVPVGRVMGELSAREVIFVLSVCVCVCVCVWWVGGGSGR